MREAMNPPEVMNLKQAAEYLGVSPDALGMYAARHAVPAFKMGPRWRFHKPTLDRWMAEQSQPQKKAKGAGAR